MKKASPGVGPRQPQVVVLVGATGDLSRRKLLPGLFHLVNGGFIPGCRVIGISLDDLLRIPRRLFGSLRIPRRCQVRVDCGDARALRALFGAPFAVRGRLPRLREVVTLRVAVLLNAPYEWQQNSRMALNTGLSQEEIDTVAADGPVRA